MRDRAEPARFLHAHVRLALERAGVDSRWPKTDAIDAALDAAVAATGAAWPWPMPNGYSDVVSDELARVGVAASRSTIASRKSKRFTAERRPQRPKSTELLRADEVMLSRDPETGVETWRIPSGRVIRRGPIRCMCCPTTFASEDHSAHRMCDRCRSAA